MKRTAVIGAGAVVLLAAAGCGSSGGPASFLWTARSSVAFIQWQATAAGHLQGTVTGANVSGTPPRETLSSGGYPFTGTLSGNSVTLTFSVSNFLVSGQAHILGTLSGGTLTLQVPGSNGTIQTHTLTQASVSSYTNAIAALRRRMSHANVQAAKAAAAAKARGLAAAENRRPLIRQRPRWRGPHASSLAGIGTRLAR